VKLFCFDEGGVWLAAKRLESGTLRWPKAGTRTVQLTPSDLHLLLSGVDPTRTRLRRWWTPVDAPATAPPPSPVTTPSAPMTAAPTR
jgi:transposase